VDCYDEFLNKWLIHFNKKRKMKKIIFMFLLCFGLSITTYSQRATASTKDATQIRLAANIAVTSSTLFSGTLNSTSAVYTVVGTFNDPSGRYTGSSVTSGMMFIDGACRMYQITQFNSSNLSGVLNINVKPVGSLSGDVVAPSTLIGLVFDPTPNLLLPQWVFNMATKVQSCLFSHMANIIDLKLGSVSTPSVLIKTLDYTMLNTDDTILFNLDNTSVGATLTLPSASANIAKVFKIGKVDETSNILTISPAIKLTTSTTISTLNYPRTFIVQSDGTDWRVINQN
jgi:hypothetical protein